MEIVKLKVNEFSLEVDKRGINMDYISIYHKESCWWISEKEIEDLKEIILKFEKSQPPRKITAMDGENENKN